MQNDFPAQPPPDPRLSAHQPAGGAVLLLFLARGSLCLATAPSSPSQGWQRRDLGGVRIRRDLPYGVCTDFASALSVPAADGSQALHLALVVNDGQGDHLYLSLWNPVADPAWSTAPAWIACPFDAGASRTRLAITRVQIGDAGDRPFIVAEAVVDPQGAAPRRARYAIDIGRATAPTVSPLLAPRWIEHKLPIDGQAEVYACCLGRSRGGWDVDGVYLAASGSDGAQLLYAPLYNPFNPMQPRWSRRLELPGQLAVDAIAPCRNADNTSDLYVSAQGGLYYFSASNQFEGAQGLLIGQAPVFADLRSLCAVAVGKRVTVWGLNRAGQVIQTSAPRVYVADPAAWTAPRVVLSNAQAIAPCPDVETDADTCFAYTNNGLVKLTRPDYGRWMTQAIILPPHDM